jgi:hypothetical protein
LAKELQLKPEEVRKELLLLENEDEETACHITAENVNVELLDKL